jgi:hypothetical protein
MRKKLFLTIILISFWMTITAQMDLPPSGGNPRAKITEGPMDNLK